MAMSEQEYQRIVDELKASKGHLPGREDEAGHRNNRTNASNYVLFIGIRADSATSTTRYPAQYARAMALSTRTRALSIWQVTNALSDLAVRLYRRIDGMASPTADDFDRALAEMQAAVELAEGMSA
jgi:hypothetical protein